MLFAAVLLNGLAVAQVGSAQSKLSPELQQIIVESEAEHAFWAIVVRDSSGSYLEKYNAQKLFTPASNLKLVTSAVALDELGADFTYKTYMYGVGKQQDSVWNGNIIIRGSGDPSISGHFYDGYRLFVLHEFYEALDSLGIQVIDGNLVGNNSYFDDKPYPGGWMWDDLTFYYAPQISALSFNNNTVDLTVYADGAVGNVPTIRWFPFDTDYVNFINEQLITPSDTYYDEFYQRFLGTNTILLRSYLPYGYVEKEELTILNPSMYFIDTFQKYLMQGGIEVTGALVVDNRQNNWNSDLYNVLDMHESHSLKDLLKRLNKESDNFYAEMLLKTAAAEHYDIQGTTELGIRLAKDFVESFGADASDIVMNDGSGLSANSLISPNILTALLLGMMDHEEFEVYKNSLPVAGVDGSLEYRFKNTPLIGQISAKTGYISSVRGLSGYLTTNRNQTVAFSIFTNHYTTSTSYVDYLHELILEQIYLSY